MDINQQKNKSVFAVVDCNNFFVSCERSFRPELQRKPVAVLSNNDGCIIARSNEVKALGIPMGAPVYKWKEFLKQNGVTLFSANFALYSDMSRRVMQTLAEFSPDMEIYSVDEAFLSLRDISIHSTTEYSNIIRSAILQNTGIPVSIGIASTKTLAKVADHIAKKQTEWGGVLDFSSLTETEIDAYLEKYPVGDIWGIGWKHTKFLNSHGVFTAKSLKYADDKWIRRNMSVMGLRTVMELRGVSCLPLEKVRDLQKGVMSTRSFGRYVESVDELQEAVSLYMARACEKLREQKAIASYLTIFIRTNKHNSQHKQYFNSMTIPLENPSSFTPYLTKLALMGVRKIFKPGYKYNKAGVILGGILPEDYIQQDLYLMTDEPRDKNKELMGVVDRLNHKYGSNTVYLASEGVDFNWRMKQEQRSPRYTTSWEELLEVKL
jgi:DNA polymerase V